VAVTRHAVAHDDWDEALQRLNGHFLQSSLWQRVQTALGYRVLNARDGNWMWAAAVRDGRFPRYMYVPYGPTASDAAGAALESVTTAARRSGLDFARVEPGGSGIEAALRAAGAMRVHQVQPPSTWILDLDQDEAALRHGLEAGHRNRINAAARRGLTITSSGEVSAVEHFIDMQRRSGASGGYGGRPGAYHRSVARVLMPAGASSVYTARTAQDIVAAAIAYDFGGTRYYAHASSDPGARRLGAGAPLVWQMILDARAAGMRHFDFWGVVPDAPEGHPWSGFSRFKMAFGGRLVERAGTWEIPVRGLRHRVFTLAQTVRRRGSQ
jgi:hypothetical protein